MEAEINIAAILKDKPQGIRLYSPIFGECAFCSVQNITDSISVKKHNGEEELFNSKGLYCTLGEVMLYPSKEMRDWSKITWKKGDVLVSNDDDSHIIFNGFSKDDYTTFEGEHYVGLSERRYIFYLSMQNTQGYHIEYDKDAAQTYINTIEKRLGGKLNMETLEIEKAQPEFKDGDIVRCINGTIVLIKEISFSQKVYFHAYIFLNKLFFQDNSSAYYGHAKDIERIATEEEKQQLFSALSKENKAWDAEKKQIVDLKPKWTPKPFDRVITRDTVDDIWTANIFSHIDSHGEYVTIACVGGYTYCLPYNEDTAKLIGTTKDVEG